MNNFIDAVILGAIQGLTEFLPVSSSGHLVIAQNLLNINQQGILFEVVLHAATTLAILFYFRKDLIEFIRKDWKLVIIGTIPAVVVGFLFKDLVENLFNSTRVVGFALLFTAAFNYLTDKSHARREAVTKLDSVFIGLMQAFAIVPGISRSGSTIFAGTYSGVKRETAAKFSFLLSIPAVVGANVLEFYSANSFDGVNISYYIVGFITAFLFGIVAIAVVMRLLAEKKFRVFAIYTALVGALVILL